jgi:hypothetical protein
MRSLDSYCSKQSIIATLRGIQKSLSASPSDESVALQQRRKMTAEGASGDGDSAGACEPVESTGNADDAKLSKAATALFHRSVTRTSARLPGNCHGLRVAGSAGQTGDIGQRH